MIIIPNCHVTKVYESDESEYTALFLLAKKLVAYLERATESRTVGYTVFGGGLLHAHLPRERITNAISRAARR